MTKDVDLERLLSNPRRLNIYASLVLGMCTVLLAGITYVMGFSWHEETADLDLSFYLILGVAAAIPIIGLLIGRLTIKRFQVGKSASKTPWKLFLSISVFQMFMISTIYVLGVIVGFRDRSVLHILYFYAIAGIWWIICWPRKGAYQKLLNRLS